MATIKATEVLVVDDSVTDAELTLHALRMGENTPHATWLSSAEEALFYMFRARQYANCELALPDLVLLDVDMPGIGGVGALARLKRDPRTKAVPIVMLSSREDAATIQRCYDLGANSYLVKPVAAIDYFQAIAGAARYWLALNARLEHGVETSQRARRGMANHSGPTRSDVDLAAPVSAQTGPVAHVR
jgi:two-component system, response regulator